MTEIGSVVTVNVCGKEYDIRPTFAVLIRSEKKIGSIMALMSRIGDGKMMTAEEVAAVLREGVASADKNSPGFADILKSVSESPEKLAEGLTGALAIMTCALPKSRGEASEETPTAAE